MSMHPSLRSASKMKAIKSVLTRLERIKDLIQKGKSVDDMSGFNLPKTKVLKVKIAKKAAKEEKKEEGEVAEAEKKE